MRPVLLALVLPLAGAACSPVQSAVAPVPLPTAEVSAARAQCPTPRRIVVGIDRSGSFGGLRTATDEIAGLIERSACPGDEWYLRFIEEESYRPSAAIQTLQFVLVPDRPEAPTHVFDQRTHRAKVEQWARVARRFTQQRREAGDMLRQLAPPPAGGTDVLGFLVKGGELLANTPPGTARVLIMATDLQENVGRQVSYALPGIAVVVLAFEGESAEEAPALRDAWDHALRSSGAASVLFRDASEPFPLRLDDLTGTQQAEG